MRALPKVALALSLILALVGAALAADAPAPPQPQAPPQQQAQVQLGSQTTATVTGQVVTSAGEPLSGGLVHFFNDASGPPPSQEKYWRVPDLMRRLDKDGKFSVQLPEGKYYLGANKRSSGRAVGPPQEGDLFYLSTDDKGEPRLYQAKAGEPLDLGRLSGAKPFKSSTLNYGKGITAIEGTVVDGEGKPVDKAHVFAFISASVVGRPLFAAEPTGKDGKFILRVSDAGSYYLKVRSSYGGAPPVAGEMVGSFGDKAPVPVTLKKGERLKDLTLHVVRFAGRGVRQPPAK